MNLQLPGGQLHRPLQQSYNSWLPGTEKYVRHRYRSLHVSILRLLLAMLAPHLGFSGIVLLGGAWGAFAFPMYSIAVAYANDYADHDEYVKVSAGLLLVYGIGAIIGPFAASALITLRGAEGLFLFTAAVHVLLIGFVAYRFLKEGTQADQPIAFGDALSSAQTASQVYEEEMEE